QYRPHRSLSIHRLITGSALNIGHSVALRLARDRFDIAQNDVSSKCDQLSAVATEIQEIGRRTALVQGTAEELGGWMS
ncbi:hypothetical protein L210DRAFT_3533361, partial [Boletus edulis BED1]